jgi:hypothetical protein
MNTYTFSTCLFSSHTVWLQAKQVHFDLRQSLYFAYPHIHPQTHLHAHTHVHIHTQARTSRLHTYTHTHTHAGCIHIHTCMHTHMHCRLQQRPSRQSLSLQRYAFRPSCVHARCAGACKLQKMLHGACICSGLCVCVNVCVCLLKDAYLCQP